MSRLAVCCCLAALWYAPLFAQPDSTDATADTTAEEEVTELDGMVVTATRTKRRLSDVPVSVSVIGRPEIESSPARNVDDLLLGEPGVSVKRLVGMGEGFPAQIIVRGVPGAYAANRMLVMVDGIPTNVASAPFMILNLVPMEAVDHVEFVRGPFSSLYGSNAFSGVLSIVTRQNREDAFDASLYYDFFPTFYNDVGLWSSGDIGPVTYMATGSLRGIDDVLGQDSENFEYADQRVLGRVQYWINDETSLTVHGRFFNCDQGFGFTEPDSGYPISVGNLAQTYLGGAGFATRFADRIDFRASGYGRKLAADYKSSAYDPLLIRTTSQLDTGGYVPSIWHSFTYDARLDVQATTPIGPWNSVTVGADYLYNSATFGTTYERETRTALYDGDYARIHNIGAFVQDEIEIGDRINAVPGVRIDYHTDAGTVLSPKLACSYRAFDWLHGRASFGRAFRAPSMVELYMPEQPVASGVRMMPSPYLEPEYINALDGGVEMEVGILSTTINGFGNWMKNLITPALKIDVGGGDQLVYHRNVSEAWSAGFEVALSARLHSMVTTHATYTYTDSWDASLLQPLEYVPAHMGNAGVNLHVPLGEKLSLSGSLTEYAVGERFYMEFEDDSVLYYANPVVDPDTDTKYLLPGQQTLKPYWRTDASLRVSYRERIYLSVTGMNLTDSKYRESGNVPAPGRMLSVKVGASI